MRPFRLEPILKPKVWGGRRLARLGKPVGPDETIGESWEVADLPESVEDGRSRIIEGPFAGRTLREVLEAEPRALLGTARPSAAGGFPLLVKYLDARENLSVQVHPDAAYAARHPGAHVKSEAWVVIDAEPGSVIYRGLRAGVSARELRSRIADGSVAGLLRTIPAEVGACHYLPSGTCHALGAGVLVAEVQTPSDTTFRVFDWGRTDRDLHVEEALECIRLGPEPTDERPPPTATTGALRRTILARTPDFTLERLEAEGQACFRVVTDDRPEVWCVLGEPVTLQPAGDPADESGGAPMRLSLGETVVLPAALAPTDAVMDRGASVLRTTLPSPVRGLIA